MTNLQPASTPTPAGLGYSMPAEWEKHEATWLGWPHNASDWPGKFEVIPWVYGEMARKISAGENIRLLVRHRAETNSLRATFSNTPAWICGKSNSSLHPTNRGWTRDTGPIFVRKVGRSAKPEVGNRHRPFSFQWLGQIRQLAQGHQVPETAAQAARQKTVSREMPVRLQSAIRNPQSAISSSKAAASR